MFCFVLEMCNFHNGTFMLFIEVMDHFAANQYANSLYFVLKIFQLDLNVIRDYGTLMRWLKYMYSVPK